jgi:hypothetical protein
MPQDGTLAPVDLLVHAAAIVWVESEAQLREALGQLDPEEQRGVESAVYGLHCFGIQDLLAIGSCSDVLPIYLGVNLLFSGQQK